MTPEWGTTCMTAARFYCCMSTLFPYCHCNYRVRPHTLVVVVLLGCLVHIKDADQEIYTLEATGM